MSATDKVLGRNVNRLGLSELLKFAGQGAQDAAPMQATYVQMIAIDQIVPNPFQPRVLFEPGALQTLAASIKAQGVLQPLLVRQIGDAQYQLVAGERRLQASRQAGLEKVPVIMRAFDDKTTMLVALIENMQRADLNVIEQAKAYTKIIAHTGWTHDQLAVHLGKSRSAISNELRLLQLPEFIQDYLLSGQIKEGQARCLVGLDPKVQTTLVEQIIKQQWSVRQIEQWVRQHRQSTPVRQASKELGLSSSLQAQIGAAADQLSKQLATSVAVKHQVSGRGHIRIHYEDLAALKRLIAALRQH